MAQPHEPSPPSSSSSSSSSSDRSLPRNLSSSKLNAQAPEFVPSPRSDLTPPTPPPPPPPSPPPPPPPPASLQVYHSPSPSPSPFHVPIHHVPLVHPLPHPHHHHHLPVHYHPPPPQHHFYAAQDVIPPPPQPHQSQPPPKHSDHSAPPPPPPSKTKLSDDAALKLLNQVEYYFSDLNLATTDHLMRFINKDPEGFVPISVVASFKKIKALINSHAQLATILRNSSKLVVSEDGKKVRRLHPLTESDMEELQSRIIVAENLPEDHCHQNLMKVFSSIGSVKTIRTCQPQTPNGGAASASRSAKSDNMLFSNKLHAFVEYESVELAEKAVAELNDEGNWRSGLRVRLMMKRTLKPSQVRGRKGNDGDMQGEEDDAGPAEPTTNGGKQLEDASQQSEVPSHEHPGEEHVNDKEGGQKKGRSRGRGKGRGRGHYHHHNNNRGHNVIGTPPSSNNSVGMEAGIAKQQPPGPRMPDGTRGFAMGRGKPVAVNIT